MLNPFETGQARVRGSIEVICGSMFSGKTEELLRRLRTKTRSCYCEQEGYQDEAVAEGTNELHA